MGLRDELFAGIRAKRDPKESSRQQMATMEKITTNPKGPKPGRTSSVLHNTIRASGRGRM